MSWLNYHHLNYFWEIANEGSIANASRKLNTTQSSLSSQLKTLETSFGFQLFHRVGKKLELTSEGTYVYRIAEEIFQKGKSLMSEIENQQLGIGNKRLRIGAVSTLSKNIQQLFVSPMLKSSAKIEMVSSGEEQLVEKLYKFKIDFIITDNITNLGIENFSKYLIEDFPYCLVSKKSGSDYLFAIKERGLIIPKLRGESELNLNLFLKRNGLDESYIRCEVEDTALLRLFAVNEESVVLIPKIGIYRDLIESKVHVLKYVKDFRESFYLISRPETFNLLNLDVYITHFRESFRSVNYDN